MEPVWKDYVVEDERGFVRLLYHPREKSMVPLKNNPFRNESGADAKVMVGRLTNEWLIKRDKFGALEKAVERRFLYSLSYNDLWLFWWDQNGRPFAEWRQRYPTVEVILDAIEKEDKKDRYYVSHDIFNLESMYAKEKKEYEDFVATLNWHIDVYNWKENIPKNLPRDERKDSTIVLRHRYVTHEMFDAHLEELRSLWTAQGLLNQFNTFLNKKHQHMDEVERIEKIWIEKRQTDASRDELENLAIRWDELVWEIQKLDRIMADLKIQWTFLYPNHPNEPNLEPIYGSQPGDDLPPWREEETRESLMDAQTYLQELENQLARSERQPLNLPISELYEKFVGPYKKFRFKTHTTPEELQKLYLRERQQSIDFLKVEIQKRRERVDALTLELQNYLERAAALPSKRLRPAE